MTMLIETTIPTNIPTPSRCRRARRSTPSHRIPLSKDGAWSIWRRFCIRAAGFAADEVLRLASPRCAALVDDCSKASEENLREAWANERLRLSMEVRSIGEDDRFREALTWQNPALIETAIEPLLRAPLSASDSKTRQKEALIASYIQRYAVKNESIGFFGPIGWGEYTTDVGAITMKPGRQLLASRRVWLEHWATLALARAIHARYPEIDRWMTPRLNPLLRIEDGAVVSPAGTFKLDARTVAILRSCDGATAPDSIARKLEPSDDDIDGLLDDLRTLRKQGLILWALEIPTIGHGQPYEHVLRREIETKVPVDNDLRFEALAMISRLEAARDDVAKAAGNPRRLGEARKAFDATFRDLTNLDTASRRPGMAYAGRTPLYEDCRRDLELTLGPLVQEAMALPLSLVLRGARWLAVSIAKAYRSELRDLFERMRATSANGSGGTVDFLLFLRAATPLFRSLDSVPDSVKRIHEEYQAKWKKIFLGGDGGGGGGKSGPIHLSGQTLAPLVEALFPEVADSEKDDLTSPFHSPDLMIAASSAEAIAAGDFQIVLGELHAQWNTFEQELFVAEFPNRKELEASLSADTPQGRIGPVIPEEAAGRCWPAHYSHHPLDVTFEHDTSLSSRARSQTIPISELIVDETLRLRTRDRRRSWDIMSALDFLMTEFDVPMLNKHATHTPRIAIDKMVIARETWRFVVEQKPTANSDFRFASAKDPIDRFRGTRAWARSNKLPRFCFFKRDGELKPWFVDFESPLFVEQFCKAIRAATELTVSEMYPDLTQCWLTDAEGRRYTSELRTIAVDMRAVSSNVRNARDREPTLSHQTP